MYTHVKVSDQTTAVELLPAPPSAGQAGDLEMKEMRRLRATSKRVCAPLQTTAQQDKNNRSSKLLASIRRHRHVWEVLPLFGHFL